MFLGLLNRSWPEERINIKGIHFIVTSATKVLW